MNSPLLQQIDLLKPGFAQAKYHIGHGKPVCSPVDNFSTGFFIQGVIVMTGGAHTRLDKNCGPPFHQLVNIRRNHRHSRFAGIAFFGNKNLHRMLSSAKA